MKREVRDIAGALAVGGMLLGLGVVAGCGPSEDKTGQLAETEVPGAGAVGSPEEATAASSEGPLAGTEWRLVEFQSMDDSIGTIRPEDPSLYIMRLESDGTVSMRLDCNRATGTWSVEPSADGDSGRFEFGPLAATRALCPPPSMDERIAADAAYVRGYLLREGRLYLSLMADAGIYAWERLPVEESGEAPGVGGQGADVPFETEPDAEVEASILEASPDYTREIVEMEGGTGKARYLYGRFDLDGDGREEVFVYLLGSIFCGTGGCNLLLLTDGEEGYSLVNNFPISRLPVIVSTEQNAGWRDLVRPESGGGAPPSYVRHVFDGDSYVEQERLPADPAPEGTRVLTGEFTFQDGIPLEPRN